jgi:hypothetical protein
MNTIKKRALVLGAAWTLLGLSTIVARAGYVTDIRYMPSPGHTTLTLVSYPTPGGLYQIDSFFDVFTELQQVPPPGPGATSIDSFVDVFTEIGLSSPPGGPFLIRESPTRQSTIRMTFIGPTPTGDGTVFDTEMLSLDLSGGNLGGVMIRESPTLPSLGKTSIRESPTLGLYHIDSFFDVFTELSIDGGQNWWPADRPMHLTGVPEPSTIVMAAIGLVALSAWGWRRKR